MATGQNSTNSSDTAREEDVITEPREWLSEPFAMLEREIAEEIRQYWEGRPRKDIASVASFLARQVWAKVKPVIDSYEHGGDQYAAAVREANRQRDNAWNAISDYWMPEVRTTREQLERELRRANRFQRQLMTSRRKATRATSHAVDLAGRLAKTRAELDRLQTEAAAGVRWVNGGD
ncbi:hypothetical protein [Actinocrispum wychmicini]|uniref:Uncharacterized protein n=1 Tax=Actinocrispum wychmicini TaxID=1213861 RepID=A0A4R2K020_9PSEU|nr:hypothetical protein [Actinocrispum wychmicini]TCO64922.1 hypothetical protein EV192_101706 [Actinocrispum wychmicini]